MTANRTLILALLALIVVVGPGIFWLRRRARLLAELARSIEPVSQGRPFRPLILRSAGDAGRLVAVVNEVMPVLESQIASLEGDRQLLRAVLGGMQEAVLAIDSRRRLLFANPTANNLFNLDSTSVGRPSAELVRSPQIQQAIEATLSSAGSYTEEITLPGPEGWPHGYNLVLSVHGTPMPGTPTAGAVMVFHDVSETRRLERVRQDFVANASHELKTPLASIKAYTETLLDWALHDEKVNTQFLSRIDEQADRLNQLILDLLSLARLDAGQESFQHSPMLLESAVQRVVELNRQRAESKRLSIRQEATPEAAASMILADEEAIRQIMDNLIDNAIKYTPEGGAVNISMSCPVRDEVLLKITDTGIGIPRQDLPRVFERFYRVDKARSRELGGTGLGLSIVKNLVQSLGGQIQVESVVSKGSTFSVRLPRLRPPASNTGENA